MIKKKIMSTFLAVAIIMSLFTMLSLPASADTNIYSEVWAIDAKSGGIRSGISDSASNLRRIASNSLFTPDAYDYSNPNSAVDNSKVTSLRYFTNLTYTFGGEIVNNPNGYDLSLYEITVGGWHPEAVELYLINPVIDGVTYDTMYIGDVFNNVGNMLKNAGLLRPDGEVYQECETNGNHAVTRVWLPDYIESASGVMLVDVTEKYNVDSFGNAIEYKNSLGKSSFIVNGIWYKFGTYTSQKDGFDLDAISAWTKIVRIRVLEEVWAIDAKSGGIRSGISDSASNLRKIVSNSLFAPDAYDYSNPNSAVDNSKVTSLRYFTNLTYMFENETVNNPNGYDLSLYEITIGGWHPEAVELYLINPVIDGVTYDTMYIGDVFNNVGNMLKNAGLLRPDGEVYQECEVNGNHAVTRVWLPDYIESASGVMLVDVTEKYNIDSFGNAIEYKNSLGKSSFIVNGVWYKFGTYTSQKDGFDLDAISAWIVKESY